MSTPILPHIYIFFYFAGRDHPAGHGISNSSSGVPFRDVTLVGRSSETCDVTRRGVAGDRLSGLKRGGKGRGEGKDERGERGKE